MRLDYFSPIAIPTEGPLGWKVCMPRFLTGEVVSGGEGCLTRVWAQICSLVIGFSCSDDSTAAMTNSKSVILFLEIKKLEFKYQI